MLHRNYILYLQIVQTTLTIFIYTKNKRSVELVFIDSTVRRVGDFSLKSSGLLCIGTNYGVIHAILVLILG